MRNKIVEIAKAAHSNTIADDEEFCRTDLVADFEGKLEELALTFIKEAYELGGTFRGPGIQRDIRQVIVDTLSKI